MKIPEACSLILQQLSDLIHQIKSEDFTRPCDSLSQATVGQHLRHTLEFFSCLEQGYSKGTINYDKRSHDKRMESDRELTLRAIEQAALFVKNLVAEKPLLLEVGYDRSNEEYVTVKTNAQRELVYNIEHAVHHMAIIKIGVREVASYVKLPPDFGVAVSTIRHHQQAEVSFH